MIPETQAARDPAQGLEATRSLPALFDASVVRFGGRPAIDYLGRRWNYRQLGGLVDRAAVGLRGLGVERGTRVGLCLPNTPYSVILYFAILKAGGTVVNYNPLYVERELRHQIEDSGTTIMAVPDLVAIHDKVRAVGLRTGLRHLIVCSMAAILPPGKSLLFRLSRRRDLVRLPGDAMTVPFDRLIDNSGGAEMLAVDAARDIAVLQYTGGTTGVPKGAMLSHANLSVNARQVARHLAETRPGAERMLGVLPLFHVFAMTCVMNVGIEIGAELILVPRFQAKQVLKTITKRRPTIVPGVPTIYAALSDAAQGTRHDLSSIKLCISGGAPLPREVRARFEQQTGCRLFEGYGLSETSPVATINLVNAIVDGSAGVALEGTAIEIRDPDRPGDLRPTGIVGEVSIRGPQVMLGYWQRPADTASVMIDGALRTGDLGYLDETGHLFLVDRIKDVIICGGYNVYPHVIESALYQHPAVLEAAVIGVPDPYRGEAPKAFVTLHPDATATPAELKAFLEGYVSKIEQPREIVIRTSLLPRTSVGKISKKMLRDEDQKAEA